VIKVRIADNMMADGISVLIENRGDGPRQVMRMQSDALNGWELLPADAALMSPAPTMVLPDDAARPLLDALLRWYQGAEDTRAARADLLHERARVDKLLDTISRIAQSNLILGYTDDGKPVFAERRPS